MHKSSKVEQAINLAAGLVVMVLSGFVMGLAGLMGYVILAM